MYAIDTFFNNIFERFRDFNVEIKKIFKLQLLRYQNQI